MYHFLFLFYKSHILWNKRKILRQREHLYLSYCPTPCTFSSVGKFLRKKNYGGTHQPLAKQSFDQLGINDKPRRLGPAVKGQSNKCSYPLQRKPYYSSTMFYLFYPLAHINVDFHSCTCCGSLYPSTRINVGSFIILMFKFNVF